MAVVNAKSEFGHRAFIRLTDLADQEFIVCPRYRQSGFHEVTMGLANKAGFRLRIAREIDAKKTALALVERGLGVSLAPESASVLGNDGLRYIPIRDPEIMIEIALIWRRENMSPLIRRFVDFAVHLGRQIETERSTKLVA